MRARARVGEGLGAGEKHESKDEQETQPLSVPRAPSWSPFSSSCAYIHSATSGGTVSAGRRAPLRRLWIIGPKKPTRSASRRADRPWSRARRPEVARSAAAANRPSVTAAVRTAAAWRARSSMAASAELGARVVLLADKEAL